MLFSFFSVWLQIATFLFMFFFPPITSPVKLEDVLWLKNDII